MREFHFWILYTVAGVLAKAVNLKFGKKILCHSDGGGMDAGTSYSYVPDLKEEYSTVYDSEFGYYAQNNRVKVLQWCLLPIFSFISILSLAGYVLTYVGFFFDKGKITEYADDDMRAK